MVDLIRRKFLAGGAAASVMAAARRMFARQTAQGRPATGSFYEKGPVRIHYQVTGSGFPLLLIAGGGLNSTIAGLSNPFNADRRVQGRVPLHRGGPAQRQHWPVDRARSRSTGRGIPIPTIISG